MADKIKKDFRSKVAKVAEELVKKTPKLAEHTVKSGETLSDIALKYYKHATPPYWKIILEANKEVLKGSEKNVQEGMKLDIPSLPADLKD